MPLELKKIKISAQKKFCVTSDKALMLIFYTGSNCVS